MTEGTRSDRPGAARATTTAVDDPSRDPAVPPAGRSPAGGANGSPAAGSLANDASITANLPAVGGPDDPYVDRNARAVRGSGSAPTVGPARTVTPSVTPPAAPPQRPNPLSAVDQYAALGISPGPASNGPASNSLAANNLATNSLATNTMSSAPTVTGAAFAGTLAPAPPLPPAAGGQAPGSIAPGAPPAAGGTPPTARTLRRPRNERTPRRARLQLRHFNVWTVFKFSVVLAVALFFVWMIIVAVLYGTLDHLKVIDKINKTVQTIENNNADNTKDAVTPRVVFTGAFLIGLVNIVLFIVLTSIGSVVYNLCADLVGGIEVTLAERD